MTDIHIDDFYKDAGHILARLYQSFPRKDTVYVEDISGPDVPDEFGLHSDRFLACFSTMLWLSQTGYLTYETIVRQEAIDQATLTQKGFLALSSPYPMPAREGLDDELPVSIQEETSATIIQLRNALKSRSSINIKHCVRCILQTS